MEEFHFTGKQFKEMGWDGNLNTLEDFKLKVKLALENGWNPEEMSFQDFLELFEDEDDDFDDEEDGEEDLEERRRRAEEAGWDEDEMDLEEFEDYFM